MIISRLVFYLFFTILFSLCALSGSMQQALASEAVWIKGALPEGAAIEGEWKWDDKLLDAESKTHVQFSGDLLSRHSFNIKKTICVENNYSIIQYLYIDPDNIPSGIMLKLFIASDEAISFYWEGNEEAFVDLDEYIDAWYMGFMPQAGMWIKLVIDFRELDIPKAELSGMEFILSNGKVWWGRTIIEKIS
jgi:hypothetical protein